MAEGEGKHNGGDGGGAELALLRAIARRSHDRYAHISENDLSPDDCKTAFQEFDLDGNGLIDATEFTHFVTSTLGLKLKKSELHQLWRMLDVTSSGTVSYHELTPSPPHLPLDALPCSPSLGCPPLLTSPW